MGFIYTSTTIAILCLFCALCSTQELRVVVFPAYPFAFYNDTGLTGFAVEMWEQVVLELNTSFGYQLTSVYTNSSASGFNRALRDDSDIGIYGYATTPDQQVMFASSIPYKFTIIRALGSLALIKTTFEVIGDIFVNSSFLQIVLLLLVFTVGASTITWAVERHRNEEQFHRNFFSGQGVSMYWLWITITTVGYGDIVPKTPWGRATSVFYLIISVVLFDLLAGVVTSVLTLNQISPPPITVLDFSALAVSVVGNTYAETLARSSDAKVLIVANAEEGVQTIQNKTSRYFLGEQDSLLRLNYTIADIQFVGEDMADVNHSFLFPNTSSSNTDFYSDVNMAISIVKGSPVYVQLLFKYFLSIYEGPRANAQSQSRREWLPTELLAGALGLYYVVVLLMWAIVGIINFRNKKGVGREGRRRERELEEGNNDDSNKNDNDNKNNNEDNKDDNNEDNKDDNNKERHTFKLSDKHPHATRLGLPTR